jgi:hypothetical protein
MENDVGQTLAAYSIGPLHYWKNEAANAEVGFLWQSPQGYILPLEVKSGSNPKNKSLRIYDEKFHHARMLRTTLLNLRREGKILSIPLYRLADINRLALAHARRGRSFFEAGHL